MQWKGGIASLQCMRTGKTSHGSSVLMMLQKQLIFYGCMLQQHKILSGTQKELDGTSKQKPSLAEIIFHLHFGIFLIKACLSVFTRETNKQ